MTTEYFKESVPYMWQLIIALLTGYLGYVAGKRKTDSEIKHLDIETEIEEVELSDKVIEFYKKQTAEILKKVAELQSTITSMQKQIDFLKANQCLIQDCPVRVQYLSENKKKKQ